MQQKRILTAASAVLAFVLAGASGAQAQDAKAIVQRADAVVNDSKTYQANEKTVMSVGALGSTTLDMDMKMIPGKKSNVKITADPIDKGTGQMAMMTAILSWQQVDDGKTMYLYMPAMARYVKMPHGADASSMTGMGMGINLGDFKLQKGVYKLLAPTKIDGRAMYTVSFKPTGMPSNPGMQIQTYLFYIDRATYHIKRIQVNATAQGQPVTMTTTTVSEKFNAPIPSSAFVFTPPPGATEQAGGLGGMMGSLGGAGGMRPGQ